MVDQFKNHKFSSLSLMSASINDALVVDLTFVVFGPQHVCFAMLCHLPRLEWVCGQ